MGKKPFPRNSVFVIPVLLSALTLSACGGSSADSTDNSAPTKTGVFIDAPVQGLGYQTPSHQGTTNNKGEFRYKEGEMVSFFFDGIDLGEVPAKAIVPVTMLTHSTDLARAAQTLDTNPDPDKIDLSGVSLGENLKTELREAREGNSSKSIEEMLSDEVLADLQAENGVVFQHQTLVSHSVAANHVKDAVTAIPMNNADISRKAFIENHSNGFLALSFAQNGIGSLLGVETIDFETNEEEMYGNDFTWSLNSDKNLQIAFSDSDQSTATRLSKNGNEIDFFVEGEDDFLTEWQEVLPLSLADLNNLHLKDDTSDEEFCSERTISFNTNNVTMTERCDGELESIEFQSEAHPHLDNAILLTLTDEADTYSIVLFLIDGNVTDGTFVIINFGNQLFRSITKTRMVQVDNPLQ